MESLHWILTADVIAFLTLAGVTAKFIVAQAQRITKTEMRLAALEGAVDSLSDESGKAEKRFDAIEVRMAKLETKMELLVEGQREIKEILRSRG